MLQPILSKLLNGFLLVTGFIACPCHLPLTLPLLLALTAGTTLGAFLANNVWLVFALSGAYFVGALLFVMRGLWRQNESASASHSLANRSVQLVSGNDRHNALDLNSVSSLRAAQPSCCAAQAPLAREATHE